MSAEQEIVHVVIAILRNKNEVLVSRRRSDTHLGGLLEFPGGKVEQNESPFSALQREIKEELNVEIINASPLIQIPFNYSDRKILLDTYLVDEYIGKVNGQEGQEICWQSIEALRPDEFPAANYGVIQALQLPRIFSVTPDYSEDSENFLSNFENVVRKESTQIIQLRSHNLNRSDYMDLSKQCAELCNKHSVKLILNRDVDEFDGALSSGLHLTSDRLLNAKRRPLNKPYLVGASCHNAKEIECANRLKLDYIFIGPVIEKNHSKNNMKLDWSGFAALSHKSEAPVYAIGGLNKSDLDKSIQHGGQGIAAIREFWSESD